jgi:hypothetical protein
VLARLQRSLRLTSKTDAKELHSGPAARKLCANWACLGRSGVSHRRDALVCGA